MPALRSKKFRKVSQGSFGEPPGVCSAQTRTGDEGGSTRGKKTRGLVAPKSPSQCQHSARTAKHVNLGATDAGKPASEKPNAPKKGEEPVTDPEPDTDSGRATVRNMRSKCRCSYVLQFTFRRAVRCVLHRPPSQVIHCAAWSLQDSCSFELPEENANENEKKKR